MCDPYFNPMAPPDPVRCREQSINVRNSRNIRSNVVNACLPSTLKRKAVLASTPKLSGQMGLPCRSTPLQAVTLRTFFDSISKVPVKCTPFISV